MGFFLVTLCVGTLLCSLFSCFTFVAFEIQYVIPLLYYSSLDMLNIPGLAIFISFLYIGRGPGLPLDREVSIHQSLTLPLLRRGRFYSSWFVVLLQILSQITCRRALSAFVTYPSSHISYPSQEIHIDKT